MKNSRNHLLCSVTQLLTTGVHLVHAFGIRHREVQMETAATLVVPWLTHERGQQAFRRGDVFDRALEQEGAICRIECLGVPQVDFVLRW